MLSLLAALATPLGAMMAHTGLGSLPDTSLALLMGLAAGSFLYIGTTEILPQLHRLRIRGTLTPFLVGLGVMLISSIFDFEYR